MSDDTDKIKLIPIKRWDLAELKNKSDLVLILTLPQDFDASCIDGRKLHFLLNQQNIVGIVESLQSKIGLVSRDSDKPLN